MMRLYPYDFGVKGLYKNVPGWTAMPPGQEVGPFFPSKQFGMQGKIIDDYRPGMIGRALRGGCRS